MKHPIGFPRSDLRKIPLGLMAFPDFLRDVGIGIGPTRWAPDRASGKRRGSGLERHLLPFRTIRTACCSRRWWRL